MSYKQIRETQLAMIVKLDELQGLLNAFYKLIDRLVDENAATNIIHKDLMTVIRSQADFMARVPNLLNTLIDMLTQERMSVTEGIEEINDIKSKVDGMYEFVRQIKDSMTQETIDNDSSNNTDQQE